jgi:DNA-binding transcriptional ArsR family regulator
MARESRIKVWARIFDVLGEPTRLNLLVTLQAGELNVTALCKKLKIRQAGASHHLGILRMAGLVNNRRAGKEVFYKVNNSPKSVLAIQAFLKNAVIGK